jgi:hypothetical protein
MATFKVMVETGIIAYWFSSTNQSPTFNKVDEDTLLSLTAPVVRQINVFFV